MSTLGEMGEFGFIRRITRDLRVSDDVVVGAGDDCAVVRMGDRLMLVTCDASLEDVHFKRDLAAPEDIGWKAMASALSDISAMGGVPRYCVITLGLPADLDPATGEELFHGMKTCADASGALIIGGDVTRSPSGIVIDVTAIGEAPDDRYVLRGGAQPGDVLVVTGTLGTAEAGLFASEQCLDLPKLKRAHFRPESRALAGQWLAREANARAMIDISDGLLQDAGHLIEASGCGIDIDPTAVPVDPLLMADDAEFGIDPLAIAMTSGEEYELLAAIPSENARAVATRFQEALGIPLTIIGKCTARGAGLTLAGNAADPMGFDHFRL